MTLRNLKQGDLLEAINNDPFPGKKVSPPLIIGYYYPLKTVFVCGCSEQHLDVGLVSEHNFITCYKCGDELPNGDKIHWAHASRFVRPLEAVGTEEVYSKEVLDNNDDVPLQASNEPDMAVDADPQFQGFGGGSGGGGGAEGSWGEGNDDQRGNDADIDRDDSQTQDTSDDNTDTD